MSATMWWFCGIYVAVAAILVVVVSMMRARAVEEGETRPIPWWGFVLLCAVVALWPLILAAFLLAAIMDMLFVRGE